MKISEVARRSGVLPTTIRFYENIGLLPPPHRVNGQRVYGADVLDRLSLICFGLSTGFSLKEIKALFVHVGSRRKRRNAVESKLTQLRNLRDHIRAMEKLLKEVELCQCGTIRQIAERLTESGVLGGLPKTPRSGELSGKFPRLGSSRFRNLMLRADREPALKDS